MRAVTPANVTQPERFLRVFEVIRAPLLIGWITAAGGTRSMLRRRAALHGARTPARVVRTSGRGPGVDRARWRVPVSSRGAIPLEEGSREPAGCQTRPDRRAQVRRHAVA